MKPITDEEIGLLNGLREDCGEYISTAEWLVEEDSDDDYDEEYCIIVKLREGKRRVCEGLYKPEADYIAVLHNALPGLLARIEGESK